MHITPAEPICNYKFRTCKCSECIIFKEYVVESLPTYYRMKLFLQYTIAIILGPLQIVTYLTIIIPFISYVFSGRWNIWALLVKNQRYEFTSGANGFDVCKFENKALCSIILVFSDAYRAADYIRLRPTNTNKDWSDSSKFYQYPREKRIKTRQIIMPR